MKWAQIDQKSIFIGYAGRARSDMSRMLYSFVAIFMLFIPVSRFLNLDAESYLNSNLNQILDSNPDQSDVVHFEGRKLQRLSFFYLLGPSTVLPQPSTDRSGPKLKTI